MARAADSSQEAPSLAGSREGAAPTPDTGRSHSDAAGAQGGRAELDRGGSVDRYVLVKKVGSGGMGVVYAAYDPELDRKVALKLLRAGVDSPESSEGRARMLREAKAMARVSHPHVCAVYDAGTFGAQLFIAMEFVEGPTLHDWLEGPARPWRHLLRVFLEAGAGLSAAHRVGLVHRDFKPGNVLIDLAEHAKVTDFGLARLAAGEQAVPPPEVVASGPGAGAALDSPVTQAGVVVGTPAYMPPEQYLGIALDARSDQFSFCAALYWALYRQRPFEPARILEEARRLARQPAAAPLPGLIAEPPASTAVPKWVRRAVLRGLSPRPEDRFASMEALLAELSQEPRRVRRRRALWGAGLGAVALAGAGVALHQRSQVCDGAEQQVAQVWNAQARGKLETAFLATGKPYARDMAQSVSRVLDTYASAWARQHTEACEATRVRGVQTEQLLSLQVVCLERRRKELGALTRLFTTADGRLVREAVDVANTLPSPRDCADVQNLSDEPQWPSDPERRARVEKVDGELAELQVLNRVGRYEEAVKRATALEPEATATGHRPLLAELHSVLGWAQRLTGDTEASARTLEQAVNDAEAARADRLKADALSQLLYVRGIQGQHEQAWQWGRLAESTIARLGGDVELSSRLKGNQGSVELSAGRYSQARRYFEEEQALEKEVLPEDHLRRIRTTYNLGVTALLSGDYPRAGELLSEALRRRQAILGRQHPDVAQCHAMLSWAFREGGQPERGLEEAQQSVALFQTLFAPEHAKVAEALDAVGMSQLKLQRNEDARRTFEEALAMKRKVQGLQHPDLSYSYDGVGRALLAAGRPAEAIAPLRQALTFESVGPEPLADSGFALAQALWDARQSPAEALAVADKARERYVQVEKPERAAEVEAWMKAHGAPQRAAAPVKPSP